MLRYMANMSSLIVANSSCADVMETRLSVAVKQVVDTK